MSPSVGTLDELGAAVAAFPSLEGFSLGWSAGAREAARRSVQRHGLCLLGEVHGVAENALVIEALIAELGVEVVALEWPEGLEAAVEDLALLGDRDGVAWSGDGRITAGHFAVLRRAGVRAVGVDEAAGSSSADARDAAMARNVERLVGSGAGPVLFVAGNLHTSLQPHQHFVAAGVHLARGHPDLCALDIHYACGRFWNLGPRTFGGSTPPAGPHVVVGEATEAVVPCDTAQSWANTCSYSIAGNTSRRVERPGPRRVVRRDSPS